MDNGEDEVPSEDGKAWEVSIASEWLNVDEKLSIPFSGKVYHQQLKQNFMQQTSKHEPEYSGEAVAFPETTESGSARVRSYLAGQMSLFPVLSLVFLKSQFYLLWN